MVRIYKSIWEDAGYGRFYVSRAKGEMNFSFVGSLGSDKNSCGLIPPATNFMDVSKRWRCREWLRLTKYQSLRNLATSMCHHFFSMFPGRQSLKTLRTVALKSIQGWHFLVHLMIPQPGTWSPGSRRIDQALEQYVGKNALMPSRVQWLLLSCSMTFHEFSHICTYSVHIQYIYIT